MTPVNNFNTVNEIFQPYKASALTEKYGLTEQYAKDYPEDFAQVLLLIQSTESALQATEESAQSGEELAKRIIELQESNKSLHEQVKNSQKETMQALRKLEKSSSEIKEIMWSIANTVSICAKRFFNPIKNGLRRGVCFLTRHQVPVAVLPRENQLAIEWYPASVDEKKKHANLFRFCMGAVGLYALYSEWRRIS